VKYKDIFSLTAGTLAGPSISPHMKPDTTPVFAKAREIPIALIVRDMYAQEIDMIDVVIDGPTNGNGHRCAGIVSENTLRKIIK